MEGKSTKISNYVATSFRKSHTILLFKEIETRQKIFQNQMEKYSKKV